MVELGTHLREGVVPTRLRLPSPEIGQVENCHSFGPQFWTNIRLYGNTRSHSESWAELTSEPYLISSVVSRVLLLHIHAVASGRDVSYTVATQRTIKRLKFNESG